MTNFIANTLSSKPDQRDIPFVPRTGIVIAPKLDLMPGVFELVKTWGKGEK